MDGFLNSVASVRRKDLGQAVEEFIESRRLKISPASKASAQNCHPKPTIKTRSGCGNSPRRFPAMPSATHEAPPTIICRTTPRSAPRRGTSGAAL